MAASSPTPVCCSTVDALRAALVDASTTRVRLALSGSPYSLGAEGLHLARADVTLEAEAAEEVQAMEAEPAAPAATDNEPSASPPPPVVLVGALTLMAGELRSLSIHPKRGADPGTISVDFPRGSTAIVRGCDITAAPPVAPRPSSRAVSSSARPPSRAATAGGGLGSARDGGELAVAVRIGSGSTAQMVRCRIHGSVCVGGEGAAPHLEDNTILGGGGVTLRATAAGCTLSGNAICDSRATGVLMCDRAAGTLSANRIVRSAGAGLEVAGASTPSVVRNSILDAGGVGLLVRSAACGDFAENVVRGAWSSAAELCGAGTDAALCDNQFLDGKSRGVGVLVRDGAAPTLSGGEVAGHAIAGIEVGDGAKPCIERVSVRRCGQAGVLLAARAAGTLRANKIEANLRCGIECASDAAGLLVEGNTISHHKAGVGILVRAGGGGLWLGNTVSGNAIGVEVEGAGAHPEMRKNKVHGNLRLGVRVAAGASAAFVDGSIRSNGHSCVVHKGGGGGRRGVPKPLVGDSNGAGVVVLVGGVAKLEGNAISANAGAGVFADAHARLELSGNAFRSNQGDAVRARPSTSTTLAEADAKCSDVRRAVTPAIVRRQRVPFDWTVEGGSAGNRVSADDKTLDDRVAEMRAQYRAMSSDKETSAANMIPEGVDPSILCVVS